MVEIFRRNLVVKVVSFLFAILFWLFVLNQGETNKLLPEHTNNSTGSQWIRSKYGRYDPAAFSPCSFSND